MNIITVITFYTAFFKWKSSQIYHFNFLRYFGNFRWILCYHTFNIDPQWSKRNMESGLLETCLHKRRIRQAFSLSLFIYMSMNNYRNLPNIGAGRDSKVKSDVSIRPSVCLSACLSSTLLGYSVTPFHTGSFTYVSPQITLSSMRNLQRTKSAK